MIDNIFLYLILLNEYVDKHFLFSIIILIIFAIFYNSLSLPGNLIIFISSGYFFGYFFGFIINIISIVLIRFFFGINLFVLSYIYEIYF